MQHPFATAALILAATSPVSADTAGYTRFSVEAEHHGRAMNGVIWYPSEGDAEPSLFAENPVFYGVPVMEEARLSDGTYPVVLLSHGMGGNIRSMAWLATDLAEQGAIVVSVSHPNSTWGDFDMEAGLNHWTRVQDLSLALDTLMADPRFAGHLDPNRIMAAGFSYGGWTALSMGGLRGNHAGYIAHCADYAESSVHCADLMSAGIQVADVEGAIWDASYADPRITHVTAIDPGLIWGLTKDDTAELLDTVRLVGLGSGEDRLLAADFDASGFASLLPNAEVVNIAPAMHFTALPLCKPMAEAILIEENDDPVCSDPDGTDRAAVHEQIVSGILSDLGL